MSHPTTYRAAQISTVGGKFEIVIKQWHDPLPGQVILKVEACGVCHSDCLVVDQAMPTGLPRIPGHEMIGRVVAVGEGERRWKIGERVGSGWHGGHCGVCVSCRKGDFITCSAGKVFFFFFFFSFHVSFFLSFFLSSSFFFSTAFFFFNYRLKMN
jgi:D-arabinose 1-dehydrogenase-like Zn-dependent alcohol dehydrogenase